MTEGRRIIVMFLTFAAAASGGDVGSLKDCQYSVTFYDAGMNRGGLPAGRCPRPS
jgi:hypothetical protein